jgi:hypothetical protein
MMARSVRGRRLAQLVLLTVAAGELSAAAAEMLVLRSNGPRAPRHYASGSRHPDNTVFELRPGDSLVVLAPGGTRNWRGPGFFGLNQGPAVLANGQRVRVNAGVVRAPPRQEGVLPTQYWDFDIRSEGHLCVASGAGPSLWRPRSSAPIRVTITAASGTSHSFQWPAGQTRIEWPDAVPVRDGARYFLATAGAAQPVGITTHILAPAAGDRTDQIATQLVQRGCQAQLDTLIATRVDPAAPVVQPAAGRAGGLR